MSASREQETYHDDPKNGLIQISGVESILANSVATSLLTLLSRFGQMISIFFSFSQSNGVSVSLQGESVSAAALGNQSR